MLSWWEPAGEGHALKLSRWDGRSFSPAATIATPDAPVVNWADTPAVTRAGDGALVAWWPQQSGDSPYAYEVTLARSMDEGLTWSPLGPVHDDGTATEHGFVSMAAEGDGSRVAWLDGRAMVDGGPMQLRTAVVGETIAASQVIDARTCDCCGTAQVSTPAGPVLIYRDRSDNETRDIQVTRLGADGWSPPVPVHADHWQIGGCPVNGPRATLAGSHLAVAWTTGVAGPRVRAAWSAATAPTAFQPAVELDGPDDRGEPLGRVDVAALGVNPEGNAPAGNTSAGNTSAGNTSGEDTIALTWLRQEDGRGEVKLATLDVDGRRSESLTVGQTTPDRKAGFPRIGRAGDALLVVWTDPRQVDSLRAVRLDIADLPTPSSKARLVGPPPGVDGGQADGMTVSVDSKLSPTLPADYRAPDLAGQQHGLAPPSPQFTMVNFFASWCPPCMMELPIIADLVKRHPDLHLVSIATDDTAAKVKVLVAQGRLSGQVLLDGSRNITPVFGATELPTTLLYDATGKLIWSHEGPLSSDEAELEALLGGQ